MGLQRVGHDRVTKHACTFISVQARLLWSNYTDYPQFASVAQSCPTLCDPMDCEMPGFPVHLQLPEIAQTHGYHISDAIQPSSPLSSPSPPALNLSKHQGLFKWVSSSHQVAKVLEFSFSISPSNEYSGLISFRIDWLDLLAVQRTLKSLLPKPQFKSISSLVLYASTLTSIHDHWKNHSFDQTDLCQQSNVCAF